MAFLLLEPPLSLEDEPEELEGDEDGFVVVFRVCPVLLVIIPPGTEDNFVYVVVSVVVLVLPLCDSVSVSVLTAPGRLVVDVYVEPALSVVVKTIGTRPVKPAESVDTGVTVEGDPEAVVVLHSVTGMARAMVVPG